MVCLQVEYTTSCWSTVRQSSKVHISLRKNKSIRWSVLVLLLVTTGLHTPHLVQSPNGHIGWFLNLSPPEGHTCAMYIQAPKGRFMLWAWPKSLCCGLELSLVRWHSFKLMKRAILEHCDLVALRFVPGDVRCTRIVCRIGLLRTLKNICKDKPWNKIMSVRIYYYWCRWMMENGCSSWCRRLATLAWLETRRIERLGLTCAPWLVVYMCFSGKCLKINFH